VSKDNERTEEEEAGNSTQAGSIENKDVQRALETILKHAGVESPENSVEMLSAVIAYEGPLPQEIFEAFKGTEQNLSSEFMERWTSAQNHSQNTTTQIVKSSFRIAHTGQWMGFVIAILGLVVTIYAVHLGQQWAAGVIGAAALGVVSIVSLFRSRQKP